VRLGAVSLVSGLTVFNNGLYFSASDGVAGIELWKSDGTPGGTVRVKDINSTSPGANSSPMAFTVLNNALLFSADDGVTGRELWRTDGSEGGTMRVKDICPGSCDGPPPVVPLPASVDLLLRPTRTPKPD
jgi:ELWxxDGT repeat protein